MPQQTTTTTSATNSAQPTTPQSATQASSTSAPTVEHQLQALQRQIDALTVQNEALAARLQQPDSSVLSQDEPRPATAPLSSTSTQAGPTHPPPAPPDLSNPPAAPADPPRLDRADLKRLTTNLEPGRVERWISNLIDTLEDYSQDAAELLRMPVHQAQVALDHSEPLRRLDRWAARQALNTMDHSQPHVRLIFDTISDDAEAARRSCVHLFFLVRAQSSVASGEAARVRLAQFDAREYFNASMDITTFHLRAGDLRNDFLSLPKERTSVRNALIRSFLTKLPPSLKEERKQLEVQLLNSEILQTPLPWKFEQLVQLVANYNILAARDTKVDVTVNAADASAKYKQSKPSAGKNIANQPCPCCGKTGHYARDCPTSCSVCKHRSCPGNYGSPCVVTAASMPQTILNALGKPLPPAIKRILVKAQSSKTKSSMQTANANFCQAETNTSDNFWGDEPAAEPEVNMIHAHQQPEWVDIDVAAAEAWLDQWRSTEVALANDRNITLPLCHGTRELQEHTKRGNDTWRLALRLGEVIVGLVGAALYASRRTLTISISQIYVIPEYRGKGIARDLIRRILARAAARSARYMALGLGIREQQATLTFWTHYGFTVAADGRRAPTINDDLILIAPSMASYDSFVSAPAPECSHADASPPSSARPRLVMIDGGSNINLFSNANVPLVGTPLSSPPLNITGWHASSTVPVTTFYKIGLQLRSTTGQCRIFNVDVAYIPQGRRDILSESAMWDLHAWTTFKEPHLQVRTSAAAFPLRRINGVYFVDATIVPPRVEAPPPPQILSLSAKHDGALNLARLWAARLHANGDVLRRLLPAADGLGIDKLSTHMAKLADQDVINKRSNARRIPSSPQAATSNLLPGELLILDAFGPVAARSVVDGAHYELEAVCASTGYGYEQSSQSITQSQWLAFLARILAFEKSLGHRVRRVRFDRVPNLHASSFEAEVNQRFQIVVEFAAQHEGVGAAEQRNDTKQRFAEADLMRSERTQSYLIPARVYAGWRLNRRVAAGRAATRYELHTGRRPNFADPVPYLFGLECSVLEDEQERGPKGAGCHPTSQHKGRTSIGTFLGVRGHGYIVKLHRGPVVERRRIIPHNEQMLLLRGLPPSAVSVDAAVQTSAPPPPAQAASRPPADAPADAAPCAAAHPSAPPPPAQAAPSPPADAPADAALHFPAPADAATVLPSSLVRAASCPPADAPADAAPYFPPPQPSDRDLPADMRGPPSTRTRLHVQQAAAGALVESHLASAPLSSVREAYDDALYQFCPSLYDDCSIVHHPSLDAARLHLLALSTNAPSRTPPGSHLLCFKATADIVQVQTDAGMQEYRVPATHAQRERAPDAIEWRKADEAALAVLLNTPSRDGRRNALVPVTKPQSLGQPLLPSVLQRRIKTDPVSKRLIKRKSRLCVAGDRQKAIQQAAGTYQPRLAHADAADDLLVKFVIADSAGSPQRPAKKRVKIDVGNAYGRGRRKRPPAYMLLGTSLRRTDDSGVELCIELNTPHYGEEPSGDEWAETLDEDVLLTGWNRAEAVPALYYFLVPGGGRATLIRVVDDMLLTYPPAARSVAECTIAKFNEFYDNDVSVCWDPDSFLGYAIIDDPQTGAVTLNMASHIEHAVRQYVPALLADPPQRPTASLRRGESLQSLADSMRHELATAALAPSQTQVQRIVGALRYPEKVLPILTLGLHRLSCVAQNPPPVASRVAELLLQLAYEHRFEGLTYGGVTDPPSAGVDATLAYGVPEQARPPDDLFACGDATWSAGIGPDAEQPPYLANLATLDADGREVASRDLYSVILTFRGAAVLHQTKKLALLVDCSMAAEEVATSKAAEHVEYASQIARALGVATAGPVHIATDNASNRQVAMRQGASNRSKHLLRRYWVLLQRVQAGEVRVVHVRDEANPADFLTKWVPAKKLRSSIAYVTGQAARRKGFVKNVILARRAGIAPH